MIVIFTGLPGAGKSLKMADTSIEVLYRNKRWYEKQVKDYNKLSTEEYLTKYELPEPTKRQMWSNLRFSAAVEEEFEGFIRYWADPYQLTTLRDVDVVWDEIATHLDSTQWQNMSLELKRWLQQHRKFGIEIYGTTQDFAMIDKSMRRLTSDLVYLTKLFGSRDKSSTMPKIKHVWGISHVKSLDPTTYDEEMSKKAEGIGFSLTFMLITKAKTEVFDTTQEISGSTYPPLRHMERNCERNDCPFHKIIHA